MSNVCVGVCVWGEGFNTQNIWGGQRRKFDQHPTQTAGPRTLTWFSDFYLQVLASLKSSPWRTHTHAHTEVIDSQQHNIFVQTSF